MKAIAVHPGQPNSIHLREVPKPALIAAGLLSVLLFPVTGLTLPKHSGAPMKAASDVEAAPAMVAM